MSADLGLFEPCAGCDVHDRSDGLAPFLIRYADDEHIIDSGMEFDDLFDFFWIDLLTRGVDAGADVAVGQAALLAEGLWPQGRLASRLAAWPTFVLRRPCAAFDEGA